LTDPLGGYVSAKSYSDFTYIVVTSDIQIQKFDQKNKLILDKTYGGNLNESIIDLIENTNGNYDIVGITSSKGATDISAWFFEIDKTNGNLLWDFTYGNLKFRKEGSTCPYGYTRSSDNSYYMTGLVSDSYYQFSNTFIVKFDTSGKMIWDYTFENENGYRYSRGVGIIVNSKKEIFIILIVCTCFKNMNIFVWLVIIQIRKSQYVYNKYNPKV